MNRLASLSALTLVSVLLVPEVARADCAIGAGYQSSVSGNTVTVCLVDQTEITSCSTTNPILRQNVQTGEVDQLAGYCLDGDAGLPDDGGVAPGQPCFVDECVPPGEYRYGLQLPYDCTQAGCGSVSLFTDAEMTTELPDSCTRAAGNSAPAEVTQTPVWVSAGGDGGVLPALACGDGGCSVASETSRSVLSADALAAIIGGLVVLVGLRRRARRA